MRLRIGYDLAEFERIEWELRDRSPFWTGEKD
jgi:hypothetical protein